MIRSCEKPEKLMISKCNLQANFCGKSGAKLSLVCTQCGYENTPGNNFCTECGHDLALPFEPIPKALSSDEKIDKIQRYLPKGLTEKILSQRDRIEGERKQVTVVFCDMEGFTAFTKRLGPEEAYGIMDRVYELLIHEIHDYEGTVTVRPLSKIWFSKIVQGPS
jgi:hypothetical protein